MLGQLTLRRTAGLTGSVEGEEATPRRFGMDGRMEGSTGCMEGCMDGRTDKSTPCLPAAGCPAWRKAGSRRPCPLPRSLYRPHIYKSSRTSDHLPFDAFPSAASYSGWLGRGNGARLKEYNAVAFRPMGFCWRIESLRARD